MVIKAAPASPNFLAFIASSNVEHPSYLDTHLYHEALRSGTLNDAVLIASETPLSYHLPRRFALVSNLNFFDRPRFQQ